MQKITMKKFMHVLKYNDMKLYIMLDKYLTNRNIILSNISTFVNQQFVKEGFDYAIRFAHGDLYSNKEMKNLYKKFKKVDKNGAIRVNGRGEIISTFFTYKVAVIDNIINYAEFLYNNRNRPDNENLYKLIRFINARKAKTNKTPSLHTILDLAGFELCTTEFFKNNITKKQLLKRLRDVKINWNAVKNIVNGNTVISTVGPISTDEEHGLTDIFNNPYNDTPF